jgi:hypothetical protein
MVAPGNITPVVLGITLPSAGNWMAILLGLYVVCAVLAVGSRMY